MTLDIRDIDDIMDALRIDQQARHPYLRDYSDYSVLTTLNEAMAIQVQYVEKRAKAVIESNSVWTATGTDLDTLVTDRNIIRQAGTRATGEVIFRTSRPTLIAIDIPLGTIVSATGNDSTEVFFETTEAGTIDIGTTSTIVDVQAIETGTTSNVPEYAINSISVNIPGVTRVENVAALTGGTESESDDDLRERYIYATDINGKATLPLMEQHIYDLETVRECQIYQVAPGEIEIIADSETDHTVDTDVTDCIEENIAAGVVGCGKLLASIDGGVVTPNLGLIEAGTLHVRVESTLVTPNESFLIEYTDTNDVSRTATVTIPDNSVKGDVIEATMYSTSNLATSVDNIVYTGSNDYSILGGLGDYPYLYLLPRMVLTNVQIGVVQTSDPDTDLDDKIQDSIEAYLDSFYIGNDIEFSDLIPYIYKDFTTGEEFVGIDQITYVIITADGDSINGFGDTITIDNDQRVEPGNITITLS